MADVWAQAEAEVIRSVPGFNKDWEREIRFGAQRQAVLAGVARQRIAQVEQHISRGGVEGLGRIIARMPVSDYLYCLHTWGPGCFSDKGFRDSILKKNPEVRVKYQPKKIMSGYGR